MRRISLLLLGVVLLLVQGCVTEPYQKNAMLNTLYRFLNNEATYKERVLFLEVKTYGELVGSSEFFITGAGISQPGIYSCAEGENILSAIGKAGQVASYDKLSYTVTRGIRGDEREIAGQVFAAGSDRIVEIQPGDLVELKTSNVEVALSQK